MEFDAKSVDWDFSVIKNDWPLQHKHRYNSTIKN